MRSSVRLHPSSLLPGPVTRAPLLIPSLRSLRSRPLADAGVYRTNERLQLVHTDLPFTSLQDKELFLNGKQISGEEPPCK